MKISPEKTKIMAFEGTNPIRSKIVVENVILEQINSFPYLGCNISYEGENDVSRKINKFLQILGLLNHTLKPSLVQKHSRIKLYKTLALPTLLYGSEIWVLKQRDISRLRAAEMKYLRRTAGYTLLDHKRNEDILQELNMQPLEEKITEYRNRWLEHISRMEAGRTPQEMLKYHPQGRRRPGRPQKRLLDPI